MKLLSFSIDRKEARAGPAHLRFGALLNEWVIDLTEAWRWAAMARRLNEAVFPASMMEFIQSSPSACGHARELLETLQREDLDTLNEAQRKPVAYRLQDVRLLPPIPRPTSLRDFYAFEQHVKTAKAIRGNEIPPEWYQFPVFYFSNPNAIFGHGQGIMVPSYTNALDFELEVACVIGRPGINITPEDASDYIFGYTIFNDWSARDVQAIETRVGLGPAKGKDFASSLGPWIVTPDELVEFGTGRVGVFDLLMTARVNGIERSRGNWCDIHYSFGEMIARASADVYLLPGDVLGSGTVGTGCLLEITRNQGPWLQPGDLVELEIERLGILANSILARSP